jgi:predicted aconitase
MNLSDADKRKLDVGEVPAVQHAMEHLVKKGEAFRAEEMIDPHSCHPLSDYRTNGDGGVEFYEMLADWGATMRVPTTCDPMSMDMRNADKL